MVTFSEGDHPKAAKFLHSKSLTCRSHGLQEGVQIFWEKREGGEKKAKGTRQLVPTSFFGIVLLCVTTVI